MDSEDSGGESTSEIEQSMEHVDRQELDSEDSRRAKIREQLSHMTFEDIQKLKEKIGLKVYNDVVLGIKTRKPKTEFKRVNKNRPAEMSSKIRPREMNSKIRPRELSSKTGSRAQAVKKFEPRDPRFDSMCGEFNDKAFRVNYKFITEMRRDEKKQLEKELAVTVDTERKKKIKLLIQRIGNQIRESEKREQLEQAKLEESRENREKIKMGEKPVYKKKSEKKIGELLHKYDELKKTNKLQKYIEKKRKKGC